MAPWQHPPERACIFLCEGPCIFFSFSPFFDFRHFVCVSIFYSFARDDGHYGKWITTG